MQSPVTSPSDACRTIFQFWDRDPPREIVNLVASWKATEPFFAHRLYDDEAALKLVTEEIGPDAAAAYQECNVPAMKADFFRYCALWAYGGIYVDVDTKHRSGLRSLYESTNRGLLFFRNKRVATDFMIVKAAREPLMRYAIDAAISNIKSRTSNNVWAVTGPGIFTELYRSSDENRAKWFGEYAMLELDVLKKTVWFTQELEYKNRDTDWKKYGDAPGRPSIFTSQAGKQR